MFSRELFILAYQIGDRKFDPTYKKMLQSQWNPYYKQKNDLEKQLKHMISFAYNNVLCYHKIFNELNLTPSDIKTIEDLEKLPILTKDIIKEKREEFKPVNLGRMERIIYNEVIL